jgi:hypothetical protein
LSAVAYANWTVRHLCLNVTNLTVAVQYPNGERTTDHVTLINVQGFVTQHCATQQWWGGPPAARKQKGLKELTSPEEQATFALTKLRI